MVQFDTREPSPLFIVFEFFSCVLLPPPKERHILTVKMCRVWPSHSHALLSMFLILIQRTFSCVDVLFVIDQATLEVSRNRAIQVARQLPEDPKIRKWVVLSRNDRYVPRVLRNNDELQSVLSTIHGDYDRFLEVATGEIERRTATFQPFVILIFSETPVNQTMTNMWRRISLSPALHIYRIGSSQRSKILSEDQETDFEKLIECGRNKTSVFNTESSKFSGENEIRRSPTSTHRPWTSTRNPFVRRLTFYDASRALIEESKKTQIPEANTKSTITKATKKASTTPMRNLKLSSTSSQPRTTVTATPSYNNNNSSSELKVEKSLVYFPTTSSTTSSPPPRSAADVSPKKQVGEDVVEQFNGKNFKVRSRSVQFAMTEKPPLKMNPMKFFTTTKPPAIKHKSLIPYSCTADVFFLVDFSQGTGDKSQMYLDIVASVVSLLPISQEAVRVGLISYSGPGRTRVRVHLDKHSDKEELIEEMFLMERHGGTTRTADAIRFATKMFESTAHPARKNVKKLLVVFTDGYSQDDPRGAARAARARGIQLFAVAVKDRLAPPNEVQLADIGGQSKNVLISPNGRELREKMIGTQCRL